MQERLSETPTDEELREYLLEHARMSALAWSVEGSQFDYATVHQWYAATLRSVRGAGADEFVEKVIEALYEGLKRLNAVPRDDPFWESGNRRPTLFKLRDYNYRVTSKNPDDVGALWVQASLYLLHGSTNFGAKQWRRLHYNKRFDVSWPVMAALITELNSSPTGNELVELIDRIEMVDEAKAFLRSLDTGGDPWVDEWRDGVLSILES